MSDADPQQKNQVIILAGPSQLEKVLGWDARYVKALTSALSNKGADVVAIGNGERNVSLEEIKKGIEAKKPSNGELIIFVDGHAGEEVFLNDKIILFAMMSFLKP